MAPPPDRPSLDGLEARWSARWETDGTYRYHPGRARSEIYAIDTPPPTVSGSLHIGHVFSYTHTDVVARFWRMQGKEVFYPLGFDDNGLPTERRVQNYFGVRCDPSLPFDPGFRPPEVAPGRQVPISRPNFVALCQELSTADEQAFEDLWRRVGLSVDWSRRYTTIGPAARRASQRGFLRLLARGEAYATEAPTLWDVDFATAISQAELEDREVDGAWHRLRFPLEDPSGALGDVDLEVETTRPELLAACVALVAHPDDPRYRAHVGRSARTPLFSAPVPVLAHPLAQPDKGTGLAMVCTFGDLTDVVWWRDLALPVRPLIGRDGRLLRPTFAAPEEAGGATWPSREPARANAASAALAGRRPPEARREVARLLDEAGALLGPPRPIRHAVKFYEKGERPLEIVTSRQWFIRVLPHRERLLARGRELEWHPPAMRARYEAWVEGLHADWGISRQRYFGVPFPLWYPLDEDARADYTRPLVASEDALPVDPSTDTPPGYSPDQRGQPLGFVAEADVMDTWATSSLTPEIAGGWEDDPALFAEVFPMDLRPQGHDIIRTWLFSTVVRSELEHGCLPWRHAAISGFVLDPDRKKMSKSKGNVVLPTDLLDRYGSDAVRYWAAATRLGVDGVADEGQARVGRRLAIKLLNVARLVHGLGPAPTDARPTPLDADLLAELAGVVHEATTALASYEHSRALELTEAFFWRFCDDYVELVKSRAYGSGPGRDAAVATLARAESIFVRLLAPYMPFVTEEIWSWSHEESVHRSPWPRPEEASDARPSGILPAVAEVLGAARKQKTAAQVSLRSPLARLVVRAAPATAPLLGAALEDLKAATVADELVVQPEDSLPDVVVDAVLSEREVS